MVLITFKSRTDFYSSIITIRSKDSFSIVLFSFADALLVLSLSSFLCSFATSYLCSYSMCIHEKSSMRMFNE